MILQPSRSTRSTAEVVAGILGSRCVTVIDVGARWGARDAWWRIAPLAKIIGFEPDAEECARLATIAKASGDHYEPTALGLKAGEAVLHATADPACSSLYPPDATLADRYPELHAIRPVEKRTLPVMDLNGWASSRQVDDIVFMKLDTQGSELDILKGGEQLLPGCLGLEIEVEFAPIYNGQPLFADIDLFLRRHGFVLWRLQEMCHYAEDLIPRPHHEDRAHFGGFDSVFRVGSGRLFWANAIYFRDYISPRMDARSRLLLASLYAATGDDAAAAKAITAALADPGWELGAAQRAHLLAHRDALASLPTRSRSKAAWQWLRRFFRDPSSSRSSFASYR